MPASFPFTRRRLVLGLVVLVVVAAVAIAVFALRGGGNSATAGATTSSSTTASLAPDAKDDAADQDGKEGSGTGSDAKSGGKDASEGTTDGADEPEPAPRKTLDPRSFDAEATPEPGVTIAVASVEEVEGEANVPGEVGGPALRFTIDITNGTGDVLDLRTVVVNAYYGPDRTPASPLLKPGGKAFDAEVPDGRSARGAFVFTVPAEQQDRVELEVDPGIGSPVIIFSGT